MSTLALHLNKHFGFSCQPWLSIYLGDAYFGGNHRIWFATALNSRANGPSSNPLRLYYDLDDIVHTNDFNHARIFQLRARLRDWIAGSALPPHQKAWIRADIASAPVPAFRPYLLKIDLANIHVQRLVSLGQYPDEYQLRDVIAAEFTIITP